METHALRSTAKIDASSLSLERVATSTQLSQQAKVKEASRAFEAVLLRQILQESQRPLFKSKYAANSTTAEIYRDQVVNQLAESISKSGTLGLGSSLAGTLQGRPESAKASAAGTSSTPMGHYSPSGTSGFLHKGIPTNKGSGITAGITSAAALRGTTQSGHLARRPHLHSPKND
jgi:Rod binding domain-containing protein